MLKIQLDFIYIISDLPPEDDVTPLATEEDDTKKGAMWFARLLALLITLSISALTIVPVKDSGDYTVNLLTCVVPIDPASVSTIGDGVNSFMQNLPNVPSGSI